MTANCPLCAAVLPEPFLRRSHVPTMQNAPAVTPELARGRARGELAIVACTTCGYVHNRAFDPAIIEYADQYDNTQSHSPQFEHYLIDLAHRLIERYALRGKRIVEVGCGKGHFLRLLCRLGGNQGFGFDPTYVGPDSVDGGAVTFVRELYSEQHRVEHTDFVCCRHVLEHVPDPLGMLATIRRATDGAPVPVFFEVPTIEWILENACFWDFFYEHCCYFSPSSLTFAFESAGYAVQAVTPAFGGQYLWLEAHARPIGEPAAPRFAREALAAVHTFANRVETETSALRQHVIEQAADGGLSIWGAGAKGVTLLNLIDPDAQLVRYVIDINPNKQGSFIPGTGHRIVGPELLATEPVHHILGMNPIYRDEIEASVASLGTFLFGWL